MLRRAERPSRDGRAPYDPALGRFLAVDPVDGGSANTYDYAYHDPVNVYDLDGRCAGCIVAGRAIWNAVRAVAKRSPRSAARRTLVASERTVARYERQLAEHGVRSVLKSARSELRQVQRHLVALYENMGTAAQRPIVRDLEKDIKELRGIRTVLQRHFDRGRSGR